MPRQLSIKFTDMTYPRTSSHWTNSSKLSLPTHYLYPHLRVDGFFSALNHDWLEKEVLNDDDRKKFMTWVIDLPHTLSITPGKILILYESY